MPSDWGAPLKPLTKMGPWVLLLVMLSQGTACTTTRTASGEITSESIELQVQAGDEIRVITSRRERFKMVITEVMAEGLIGRKLKWGASEVSPGKEISILYTDLAFIQLDEPGLTRTAIGGDIKLFYPIIETSELSLEPTDCKSLDRYLRQTDSIRWSMREDGIELETEFEQIVQLSLATAAAIAVAVPLIPMGGAELALLPYAIAFSGPDNLKRTDALLIAMLAKREELQCPPHPECVIGGDHSDTLSSLRNVRKLVENEEIKEQEGLEKLTALLDNLCPVGTGYLTSLGNKEEPPGRKFNVSEYAIRAANSTGHCNTLISSQEKWSVALWFIELE